MESEIDGSKKFLELVFIEIGHCKTIVANIVLLGTDQINLESFSSFFNGIFNPFLIASVWHCLILYQSTPRLCPTQAPYIKNISKSRQLNLCLFSVGFICQLDTTEEHRPLLCQALR